MEEDDSLATEAKHMTAQFEMLKSKSQQEVIHLFTFRGKAIMTPDILPRLTSTPPASKK